MEEMNGELLEVIKKNLPEQTAGVLKDYLEELEELKTEVEALKVLNEEKEDILREFREDHKLYVDLEKRENILKQRGADLFNREQELKLNSELMVLKGKHAEERVNDHKDMIKLIFRNTEIKREIFEQKPVASPGYVDYTSSTVVPGGEVLTDTKSVVIEESK